jgi:hypothetical protein
MAMYTNSSFNSKTEGHEIECKLIHTKLNAEAKTECKLIHTHLTYRSQGSVSWQAMRWRRK